MIYDMTDYNYNLKSISEFLDLKEEEILNFVTDSTDVMEFLETFKIEDEKLLEKNIELISLHSVNSIDSCQCIKTNGLFNLQQAVTFNTPLKSYLQSKEIEINIEEKYLIYKGKKFDLSEKVEGFCLEDEDENKNFVIHKFYEDYQINAFLSNPDVTDYDGRTRERPEILKNLAEYLNDTSIQEDWINAGQHYIIKFKQPLENYRYWTFIAHYNDDDYGITRDNLNVLTKEQIEVKVKKWIIQQSITIISEGIDAELYSYLCPNIKIEPKDIVEIMTESQYKSHYKI